MSVTVNPLLIRDIRRYGAFDISACFNCGNCTAVCTLSSEHGSFPRKLIRFGQIGDRNRLLTAPEAWLCYYCGECSDTCPRQAEPGEFMAAVRRYAIAAAEPTGLGRLMIRSAAAAALITILVAVVLGAFLATAKAGANPRSWLFRGISYEAIHLIGMGIFALAALSIAGGVIATTRRFMAASGTRVQGSGSRGRRLASLKRVVAEIATMKRHREVTAESTAGPWYARAAWVHLAIMYGFLGLLVATGLDFLFLVLLPLHLSIFWPARILGTVSGAAMLLGVTAAIARRLRKVEQNVEHSLIADWWVLVFLFVLAVTGFWLEAAVTLGLASPANDLVLLVHAAMAMEFVLLMAFTKMAHMLYRPIALFAYYLRSENSG